jgi:hypothetical protein
MGNCIALQNSKSFILFILYGGVMLLVIFCQLVCAAVLSDANFVPKWLLIVAACMVVPGSFALFGVTICLGTYLFGNTTTFDRIFNNDPDRFGADKTKSFRYMCGQCFCEWALPTGVRGCAFASSGIDLESLPFETFPVANGSEGHQSVISDD